MDANVIPLTSVLKKVKFIGWNSPDPSVFTDVTVGGFAYPIIEYGWPNTDWVIVEDYDGTLAAGRVVVDG